MNLAAILVIAAFGALGALLRHGCIVLVGEHWRPVTIVVVNAIGSFIAGLAASLIIGTGADPIWSYGIVIGFCGGFTTFSTFAGDTASLLRRKRPMRALVVTLATILGTLAFAAAGIACGEGLLVLLGPTL